MLGPVDPRLNMASSEAPARSPRVAVAREYLPLHKFLDTRFADVVVLRLAEIEDVLGCTLPDLAWRQPEWWTNPEGALPSAQSQAWIQAGRTASANLPAKKVTFERVRS